MSPAADSTTALEPLGSGRSRSPKAQKVRPAAEARAKNRRLRYDGRAPNSSQRTQKSRRARGSAAKRSGLLRALLSLASQRQRLRAAHTGVEYQEGRRLASNEGGSEIHRERTGTRRGQRPSTRGLTPAGAEVFG